MNKVFVYGTLKSGFSNNILITTNPQNKHLGDDVLEGFQMYNLGVFPIVFHSEENTDIIRGEVWEVEDSTLNRLDILEGHPTFYKRELVDTAYGKAWIYIFQEFHFSHGLEKISEWNSP